MSNTPKPASRFHFLGWNWRPVAFTGAGGIAVAIWVDEILSYVQEILGLIFLPIMAGMIYLLDNFIFRSRMPKREDLINPNDRGEQR